MLQEYQYKGRDTVIKISCIEQNVRESNDDSAEGIAHEYMYYKVNNGVLKVYNRLCNNSCFIIIDNHNYHWYEVTNQHCKSTTQVVCN